MTGSSRAHARWHMLRAAVVIVALALIALWVRFAYGIFSESQSQPAPAGIMMPVFFCVVALGAATAALRGEGVPIALAGGISLMPMGILLVLFPGSPRMIGVLDVVLIALGIALMRAEGPRDLASESDDTAVSGHPPELA